MKGRATPTQEELDRIKLGDPPRQSMISTRNASALIRLVANLAGGAIVDRELRQLAQNAYKVSIRASRRAAKLNAALHKRSTQFHWRRCLSRNDLSASFALGDWSMLPTIFCGWKVVLNDRRGLNCLLSLVVVHQLFSSNCSVHLAPYRSYGEFSWFDMELIRKTLPEQPIDILVVDGSPPGESGAFARRPALEFFLPYLQTDLLIFLHDTNDERQIAQEWAKKFRRAANCNTEKGLMGILAVVIPPPAPRNLSISRHPTITGGSTNEQEKRRLSEYRVFLTRWSGENGKEFCGPDLSLDCATHA